MRAILALLLLPLLALPAHAESDHELGRIMELAEPVRGFVSLAELDLETLPAVGFFPLGGDGPGGAPLVASSAFGAGLDLVNLHGEHARVSLLGVSTYMLGVSWNQLGTSNTRFVDLAYARIGPSVRFARLPVIGALAFNVGYAALLSADPTTRATGFQHGLDLSVSIPLFSGYDYAAELRRRQAEIVRERINACARYVESEARKAQALDDQIELLRREQARIRANVGAASTVRQQLRQEYDGLARP